MRKAASFIVDTDPAFADIVEASPVCSIGNGARTSLDPFESLVGSVIAQQVSVKAADSITARVTDYLDGDVSPEKVVNSSVEGLRVSRPLRCEDQDRQRNSRRHPYRRSRP